MPRATETRGLVPSAVAIAAGDPSISALTDIVTNAKGSVVGAYRDPLGGAPVALAALPLSAIAPTPFQRDLSPTHAKRLAAKILECGHYLDPIIAIVAPKNADGVAFWTPNGRHRLAAAKSLGLSSVMALVSGNERLGYRILALNTEKAHNLRDRSLEVIRMARDLAKREPRGKETDYVGELESPHFLTLGILYDELGRFSGSAYASMLTRVDRFLPQTLAASLRQREGWSSRLAEIDREVARIVEGLQARGFRSPYLKTLVVARINPVRWVPRAKTKKGDAPPPPPMPIGAALTKMLAAAKGFRIESVKEADLALLAGAGAKTDEE